MSLIRESLERIHRRMDEAAQSHGRSPQDVRLVAVSKTFPATAVLDAIDAGQTDFGENRVEEAREKMAAVAAARPAAPIGWHLIGHVQSRKAKDVAGRFALIHSVDSVKLAAKLSAACQAHGCTQDILLECNVSGEASKDGFHLVGWEQSAPTLERFLKDVEHIVALPAIRVRGLMTMAPVVETPEQARPVFASLRSLRDVLRAKFPQVMWEHLSMGMTDDFEAAIAEGATLIRIGRAIFGGRSEPTPTDAPSTSAAPGTPEAP